MTAMALATWMTDSAAMRPTLVPAASSALVDQHGVVELLAKSEKFARLMDLSDDRFITWFVEQRVGRRLSLRKLAQEISDTYGVAMTFNAVDRWARMLLVREGEGGDT